METCKTLAHDAFIICDNANFHWVDVNDENLYGCESSGTIAHCPQDLGCAECMTEQLKEQQQYHNDIDAAWNAAKGIR